MQKAWFQWSSAAAAAVLVLLATMPLRAADTNGVRTVAEELDQRSKAPDAGAPDASSVAPKDKLSDSSVRVMSTFAWSILPEEYPGPDGKKIKIDKSDPTKFLIPVDDARRIIRVATRSAYAEVCKLPELERANYDKMMQGEAGRKTWSKEQMIFINFLHMFAVSYFTGDMKITEDKSGDKAAKAAAPPALPGSSVTPPTPAETASAQDAPASDNAPAAADPKVVDAFVPKKPTCTPEQKEKVTSAINAYVQAANAPAAPQADQSAKVPAAPPIAKPAPAAGAN
jgi:hypothetical protein